MVGNDTTLLGGLLAAFVLFLVSFGLKKLMYKSKILSDLIQEKPEILIHNGKTEYKTLAKLNITSDEMEEAMREHGVEYFKDVKLAMLEVDGNISIISGETQLKQTHHKRRIHKTLS